MTALEALLQGTKLFEDDRISAPRLTAEVLLSYALRRDRSFLYSHPEHELTEIEWIHYGRYLHQRLNGTPTQYITHLQEFYGRPFRVTPDVLIPRPETEHVVEIAAQLAGSRVLDVGCGSGAIAVTLALETRALVFAADISVAALKIAAANSAALTARVTFVACDLESAFAPESFDCIVSNPPYVPEAELEGLPREIRDHEPREALTPGPAGFEIYQRLIAGARRTLRPGGHLVMELGYNSSDRVTGMLDGGGFENIRLTADLAGIPRVVSCSLPS